MNTYSRASMVFFVCLLLAACSPARTGVVNGTLTTNVRPAVTIRANAPFVLADSGRIWVSPTTDSLLGAADATFDYAVYRDPALSPAQRFAYASIIRFEDMESWNFVSLGRLPGSFGAIKPVDLVGRGGFIYTLYVPSAGDWASDMLANNGVEPPEAWIAQRWVIDLDKGARALAEYREPWPATMDVPASDILLIGDKDHMFLRNFEQRAIAAFSFSLERGDFTDAAAQSSTWQRSSLHPDVARLAGEIIRIVDHDGGDYDQ